jgi:hypothetical protein
MFDYLILPAAKLPIAAARGDHPGSQLWLRKGHPMRRPLHFLTRGSVKPGALRPHSNRPFASFWAVQEHGICRVRRSLDRKCNRAPLGDTGQLNATLNFTRTRLHELGEKSRKSAS